jgi:hypothetical protein
MAMTRRDVQITTSSRGGIPKRLRHSLGPLSFFVNDTTKLPKEHN